LLSSAEVKNIKFSKSMSGYKQDEVDVFLDKIEADYLQFERLSRDYQTKINSLEKEISELREAQSSIQSVLLSAQRLADNIVGEAKEKSEEIIRNAESNISVITAREKELSATFDLKAQERKNALEKELSDMIEKAKAEANSITKAADDSVKRQQILFDKLKLEIAAFKSNISSKYKEHLEILSSIPDTVPSDPEYLAKVVSSAIDKEPDISRFISNANDEPSGFSSNDISSSSDSEPINHGFKLNTVDEDF